MANDNAVRMDDNKLYLVWLYREIGTLSNVLYAIAHYKSVMGAVWPSVVVVHVDNRMTFGFGADTEVVRRKDGVLMGALYLGTYAPKMDRSDGERMPTELTCKRRPIGRAYRNRRIEHGRADEGTFHRGPVQSGHL